MSGAICPVFAEAKKPKRAGTRAVQRASRLSSVYRSTTAEFSFFLPIMPLPAGQPRLTRNRNLSEKVNLQIFCRQDLIVHRIAWRNDREHIFSGIDIADDEISPAAVCRFFEGRFQPVQSIGAVASQSESPRQFHIIDDIRKRRSGISLFKEELLPLTYHAQYIIFKQNRDDRQFVRRYRRHFIAVHAETSVAGDMNHPGVRISHLRADSRSQAESHGTQTAGSDIGARAS